MWKKWQKIIADLFNGLENPKSKGQDVVSNKYYIECKYTAGKGYRITTKTWDKIYWEAIRAGREPVIALKIDDTELAVCTLQYFLERKEE